MGFHIGYLLLTISSLLSLSVSSENVEPRIQSLSVLSLIQSRFATTLITSRVLNPASTPQQVIFQVTLPNAAFISNFTMVIDGKIIVGEVKEKAKAKEQFEAAKARGETAGLVAQKPRETNEFEISVNVGAQGKATFNLTYQEVLQRVHGVYKHVINIAPGQIVESLSVKVNIHENRKITKIHVPEVKEKAGELTNSELLKLKESKDIVVSEDKSNNFVEISWSPTEADQKKFGEKGIVGQMVVLYDVERDTTGGEVQVIGGYFVQFIAPDGLEVGSKNVVFVLDTSGSMSGDKIEQLKDAMEAILSDLKEGDEFSIVAFDDSVNVWRKKPVPFTPQNQADASKYVREELFADGGTNMHGGLERGLELIRENLSSSTLASMVVFLTDGLPTSGVTETETIIRDVKKWNARTEAQIHSIAFGDDADFDLLRKISAQNNGIARKVYAESDAAIQLKGFYDEISSPLLTKLKVQYLNETVLPESLVQNNQGALFEGSEVLVIGRLNSEILKRASNDVYDFAGSVSGKGVGGEQVLKVDHRVPCWNFCPTPHCLREGGICGSDVIICSNRCPQPEPPRREPLPLESAGGFIERMWAYLTIKKMLDRAKFEVDDKKEKKELEKKALEMSLRYNFVTELTSMVVTKPDSDKPEFVEEKVNRPEPEFEQQPLSLLALSSVIPMPKQAFIPQKSKKLSPIQTEEAAQADDESSGDFADSKNRLEEAKNGEKRVEKTGPLVLLQRTRVAVAGAPPPPPRAPSPQAGAASHSLISDDRTEIDYYESILTEEEIEPDEPSVDKPDLTKLDKTSSEQKAGKKKKDKNSGAPGVSRRQFFQNSQPMHDISANAFSLDAVPLTLRKSSSVIPLESGGRRGKLSLRGLHTTSLVQPIALADVAGFRGGRGFAADSQRDSAPSGGNALGGGLDSIARGGVVDADALGGGVDPNALDNRADANALIGKVDTHALEVKSTRQ